MKIRNTTGLLILLAVLAGGVFAFVRTRESQNLKGMHILASYASERDFPTLANTIRRSDFVGKVRILDMKRRGMLVEVNEATHQVIIDENDKNLAGDEVLLRAEDALRDGLVTEYQAEVLSVIAGSLKPGDQFTLRVPGYGPTLQKNIEKNAASSIPVEVSGDEFLYILVKQADGVFAPMNGVTFRMKQNGDRLSQTFYGREEVKDFDGSIVTMKVLFQAANDNFGKSSFTDKGTTTSRPAYTDGRPTAAPAKPVDGQ